MLIYYFFKISSLFSANLWNGCSASENIATGRIRTNILTGNTPRCTICPFTANRETYKELTFLFGKIVHINIIIIGSVVRIKNQKKIEKIIGNFYVGSDYYKVWFFFLLN